MSKRKEYLVAVWAIDGMDIISFPTDKLRRGFIKEHGKHLDKWIFIKEEK